jgi:dGTPase
MAPEPVTTAPPDPTRTERWAASVGHQRGGFRTSHPGALPGVGATAPVFREEREDHEDSYLAAGATRASGAGQRARPEDPDPYRTCFERDRDRIMHCTAFRRLAGKTQAFILALDHQRTRLTHAIEVAQVATAVARAARLNVALTEAIALGHDCGHGPGGHASEDALGPYLAEGFDHAVWGADVVLSPLNLCAATLDGIRNHSWTRPVPATPEGLVVSWADRCAYTAHDFEDACRIGVVSPSMLPGVVVARLGRSRSQQLGRFIHGLIEVTTTTGTVGMPENLAEALAEFRSFNYERVYMRPASVSQAGQVIDLLRALVDHYSSRPDRLPGDGAGLSPGSDAALRAAVTYVAGMTDRFACQSAVEELGWTADRLPAGVG